MKKRILSFLLVVAMVVAMVPATMIAAFAEASSNPTITYVGMAELDGKNTNGEYDSATKVMLNAYGNDTDGDNMRIIYTDEAVYVLIEVFDDTLVRYGTYLDDGTTKAGSSKCDFVFLGFSLGTSFQGIKRVYRDTEGGGRDIFTAPGAYVNTTDGQSSLETNYFGYTEDENGFRLEARFPVSEMSERDQAYYAAGKLELGFTAGTQDSENLGTEFALSYDGDTENRGWDGAATEDYFESGSYKAKNPSNYPAFAFEYSIEGEVEYTPSTDYVAYVKEATLDGKNTNGEYDEAYANTLDDAYWWSGTTDAKLYAIYTNDAVLIYVERTGGNTLHLFFEVGTSFIGYKGVTQTGEYQTLSLGGTVDMGSAYALAPYFARSYDGTTFGLEARLPVSEMNEEDKAAFEARTLSINVAAATTTDSATGNANETFSGMWRAFVYNSSKPASFDGYELESLVMEKTEAEPEVTGPQIPFVSGVTLDGAKTGDEYANALEIAMTYTAASDSWLHKAPDANDVAYVVYTDEAIYVYVNADCGTLGGWDMTCIGFKIGESYIGSNAAQSNSPAAYLFSSGASTVDASFFAVDSAVNLEARFPVDGMTEADKAAFADGTLEIAFNFMNMDAYTYTASFNLGSYSAYTTQSGSDTYVMPNLTSYPLEKVEIEKNDMPFISDAKYDGLNTTGEYDKADTIAIDTALSGSVKLPSGYNGTSSGTAPAGSYYKVIYDDNYIYIFVNIADTTPVYYYQTAGSETDNGAYGYTDMIAVNFTIGKSFVGSNTSYRHGTNEVANTGAGTLSGYIGTTKDNGAAGWTYEARFPVNNLTEEDKAAFAAGTLNVKFDVKIADNHVQGWGFSNGVVYVDGTHHFAFVKGTNYADEIVFDGVNTDREYNTATVITYPHGLWGYTPVGNEIMKVVYTKEAIYVLVEIKDDTPDVGTEDFHRLHISIGESFIGTKLTNKNSTATDEAYDNVGGLVNLKNYQNELFKETHTETGYTLEARFPVSLMTETDKAAYAAGTLRVAFGGASCNNWNVAMTESDGSYNAGSADYLASIPAIELAARNTVVEFAGANLSLGENININYYANIPYDKAANAFVKFTHNNKVFIVKPVAATDRIDSYVFTFKGLAPHLLGDDIDATLMLNLKAVDTVEDYSALQNCKNLLAADGTTDKAKQLIYDLLAYGAASQNYLGYKTDALVNAGYEALASTYSRFAAPATVDGVNANGEYDKAITVAIDQDVEGTVSLPIGSDKTGTATTSAPAGSYYKVLFAEDGIYVLVNVADTTPLVFTNHGHGVDQLQLNFKIGSSFEGYSGAARHSDLGIASKEIFGTNYPGEVANNDAAGWTYEIKLPVDKMTESDKEAYKNGTLSIELGVMIVDATVAGGWYTYDGGAIYADNADRSLTKVPMTDKKVGDQNLAAAYFAAAGIYHANTNKIYAKIALAFGQNVENLTVTINGVEATIEATDAENVYIVYTDDISVKDFDKTFTFVLSDGANEQTLTYSVNAYAHVKAANAKTDKMAALAQAMYCYGVSAEAYAAN